MSDASIPQATDLSQALRKGGGTADKSFRALTYVAGGTVLAVLGLITVTMVLKSRQALQHMGLEFFTSKRWNPPAEQYGILSFIWGSVYTASLAILFAVPLSIGIALFITEVAPQWLRKIVVSILDLLAVVPSVVFGLWGILVFAKHIHGFYGWLSRTFDGWPVLGTIFGPNPQGRSFFTAGIILAIMITPIIVSLSREVMETTPQAEKEAALGLGATRWEMVTGSVLPHSRGGLVGAVMLGLGRAMGETIAVALVIGSANGQLSFNALSSGNSMPAVITAEWGEADSLKKSALIAMAMTLFAMTIFVNIVATAIVNRSKRKMGVAT
jgi:phosphate transport system permease protein